MQASQAIKVKNILTGAVKRGAVDLHFSVGNMPVLRINDQLTSAEGEELVTQEFMEELIESLLDEKRKKQLDKEREIIITHSFDKKLRFKINIFYQKGVLSATLRYIPSKVPTISSLGLGDDVAKLADLKNGLVIVSGPFGSGRSTTITAIVEEINQKRKEYIITIEDPIEHIFVNKKSIIEQREVGQDTRSFKDALNYFQEENGDILFLESMQDPEVIPIALEIARGGALVLSSTSADSATKTVTRILDSFQSFDQERIRDLLASALRAVVCQKLVPRIGGGLILAYEILIVNDAARSTIAGGNLGQLDNIIQTSKKGGMTSLDHHLSELVRDRLITQEDALNNASDRKKLQGMI